MNHKTAMKRFGQREAGVALVITLSILLILTILGVSSIQTTSMGERMARNARDVNIAFQGAEAAIRDAEVLVESFTSIAAMPDEEGTGAALCNAGLCTSIDGTARWKQSFGYVDWTETATTPTTHKRASTSGSSLGAADDPRYMVEYVAKVTIEQDTLNIGNVGEGGSSGRAYVFRITARGSGGTVESAAMIQSLYGRQF